MRVAVFDLGSSSFHALVAEVRADGSLAPVQRDRFMLHLGAVVGREGLLPPDAAAAAIDALRRLRRMVDDAQCDLTLAFATAALRDAQNQTHILSELEAVAGVPIQVVDGVAEAVLARRGQQACVTVDPGRPVLGIDLGGGSLEFVYEVDGQPRWYESIEVGPARLTGELVRHDPPTRSERAAIQASASRLLAPIAAERADTPPANAATAVLSGGTGRALARLVAAQRTPEPPGSLNQLTLTVKDIARLRRAMAKLSLAERLRIPGMQARRAEVLPAGTIVLATMMEMLGLDHVVVSEWGLREGAILTALGIRAPRDLRAREVERLCVESRTDVEHARHVSTLATALFDGTAGVHGLGTATRDLLGFGAMLHDIGGSGDPGHHKRGAALLELAGLRGFAPEELDLLTTLVRYHKGSVPSPAFTPFARLSPSQRRKASTLVALLRTADALDSDHDQAVSNVRVVLGRRALRLHVSVDPPLATNASQAVERGSALLAEILGRAIRVETVDQVPSTR